jgi:hypothetical protein
MVRIQARYLRGMALMELLDPEANEKAGELFRKAVAQEPYFALGYIGLAYLFLEQEGFHRDKRLLDAAVESARRAIALDPLEVRGSQGICRHQYRPRRSSGRAPGARYYKDVGGLLPSVAQPPLPLHEFLPGPPPLLHPP